MTLLFKYSNSNQGKHIRTATHGTTWPAYTYTLSFQQTNRFVIVSVETNTFLSKQKQYTARRSFIKILQPAKTLLLKYSNLNQGKSIRIAKCINLFHID